MRRTDESAAVDQSKGRVVVVAIKSEEEEVTRWWSCSERALQIGSFLSASSISDPCFLIAIFDVECLIITA